MKIPATTLKSMIKKTATAGADKLLFGPDYLEAAGPHVTVEARERAFQEQWDPFAVTAKQLSAVASKLTGEVVLERQGNILSVASPKARYELAIAAQAPTETIIPGKGFVLPISSLLAAADYASIASAKSERFDYTSCVQIVIEQGCLRAAGTNGRRLAFSETPISAGPANLIIPTAALPAIHVLSGDVTIYPDERTIYFTDETTVISARKLAREFPVYANIVPKHFTLETSIDPAEFGELLDAASPIANEQKVFAITLHFDSTKLTATCKTKTGSFSEQISHDQSKPDPFFDEDLDFEFNVNYKWLSEFCAEADGPILFRGIDSKVPVLLECGPRKMLVSTIYKGAK